MSELIAELIEVNLKTKDGRVVSTKTFDTPYALMAYVPIIQLGRRTPTPGGYESCGPASAPPAPPPGAERLQIVFERLGEEPFTEDIEIADGSDGARKEVFHAIVRRLSGVDADRRTPHFRTYPGIGHRMTVAVEPRIAPFAGQATFTLPKLWRAV